MPKHVFVNSNETIGVHWYNTAVPDADEVAVSVGVGKWFTFHEDSTRIDQPEFDRLFFNFENKEQINEFIKALHKAKRKAFK
jgi:hypothetical protein